VQNSVSDGSSVQKAGVMWNQVTRPEMLQYILKEP
jgi:hypothetical protein